MPNAPIGSGNDRRHIHPKNAPPTFSIIHSFGLLAAISRMRIELSLQPAG